VTRDISYPCGPCYYGTPRACPACWVLYACVACHATPGGGFVLLELPLRPPTPPPCACHTCRSPGPGVICIRPADTQGGQAFPQSGSLSRPCGFSSWGCNLPRPTTRGCPADPGSAWVLPVAMLISWPHVLLAPAGGLPSAAGPSSRRWDHHQHHHPARWNGEAPLAWPQHRTTYSLSWLLSP